MLANHDQNINSRFRLAQSVFICKIGIEWLQKNFELNLQSLINWKLD